jgi:hypothetical protein
VAFLKGRWIGRHSGFVDTALPADAGGAVLGPSSSSHRHHDSTVSPGLVLACYCPLDLPCHADVLLELANGQRAD